MPWGRPNDTELACIPWGRPNDTEPAFNVPYPVDCCDHDDSECVCVTDEDILRWDTAFNTVSGLSGFDPVLLSAAMENLADMDKYASVADTVIDYSATWLSAGYVPQLFSAFDELSAKYNELAAQEYLPLSAVDNYLDPHNAHFRVWSDSIAFNNEFGASWRNGTIVGDGTKERPLRVNPDVLFPAVAGPLYSALSAISAARDDALSGLSGFVKQEDLSAYPKKDEIPQWIECKTVDEAIEQSKEDTFNFYYTVN